jgi:RNA polymerase sigma-70 factor (ECF subfamily)
MLPLERVRQEEKLRGAVLAGDKAAWRVLYDGAYEALWNYIVWRCAGTRDLAEEVTQETWLVAVRRIRDFDPHQAPFLAWLRGIAVNVLRNQLRACARRQRQSLSDLELAQIETDKHEEAEVICRTLAELPEHYEEVLRAKYLDRLSVEEIAADWAQTPKSVESLLTRAREAFRVLYEKRAGNETAIKKVKS